MQERITTAGILRQDDSYCIAQREEKGAIGGLWEFPGGKNRYGESEEKTLQREFLEELNLEIEVGPLVHQHDFTNKETLYHLKAYYVTCRNFSDIRLSVHSQYRWVSLSEMESYSFAPSDRQIVETLKQLAAETVS